VGAQGVPVDNSASIEALEGRSDEFLVRVPAECFLEPLEPRQRF
jgi:hypothetical protein